MANQRAQKAFCTDVHVSVPRVWIWQSDQFLFLISHLPIVRATDGDRGSAQVSWEEKNRPI
jgi:hypothetical protein